jgi:restriction system protein
MLVDDVSLDISMKLNSQELFGLFGLPSPIKTMTRGDSSYVNDGLALEERCKTLLESHGYTVETTPRSNDGGIDLITKLVDHLGINQELLVQCKDYGRPVGVEVVRELIGVRPIDRQVILVLAAPSGVTATAEKQAGRGSVAIWDEETLSKLEEEGHLF